MSPDSVLQSPSTVWSPQWPCRTDGNLRDRLAKCHVFFSKRQFAVTTRSACRRTGLQICRVSYCAIRSKHWHEKYRKYPRIPWPKYWSPHRHVALDSVEHLLGIRNPSWNPHNTPDACLCTPVCNNGGAPFSKH